MLIRSTDEVKQYLPANVNFDFQNVLPYVDTAEYTYIMPILGKTQYNILHTNYQNTSLDFMQSQLLMKVQKAIVNFAYAAYVPFGQVQIGNSGFQILSDEKRKTAFQWQINDIKSACEANAYSAIDEVLEFLEENKASFPDWSNSAAYTVFKECFINTASDFSQFVDIGNSRRVFLMLRATMKMVEKTFVQSVTCKPLFDEIKSQILTDTVSTANKVIIDEYIKPAVAHMTINQVIPYAAIKITENGISIFSKKQGTDKLDPANDIGLSVLRESTERTGQKYLEELRQYLHETADTYPLFKSSKCYVAPAQQIQDVNQPGSKVFGMI